MSGWDAPSGGWDSRDEREGSGGSGEHEYQQSQSSGGYRSVRAGEGRVRTGRRGLPGYEQAQGYEQGYDSGSSGYDNDGYGSQPGYGGYGSPAESGPKPTFTPNDGAMVRYAPHPGDDRGPGSADRGFGPPSGEGSGPYSSGPQDLPGAATALGAAGIGRPRNPDPLSGPRLAIESGSSSTSVPRAAIGSGAPDSAGFDQDYRGGYGSSDEPRQGWSDADSQQGYGGQSGYGGQPGYGSEPGYGSQQNYGSVPDAGWPGRDRPGAPLPHDPLGPDPRGSDPLGPDPRRPDSRGPDSRGPDSWGSDPLGPDPRRPDSRGPDSRGPESWESDPLGQDYGQRDYGQSGGHREPGYRPQGGGATGYLSPDSGPDEMSDRTQAYSPGGYDSPGYAQNDYAQSDYAQNGYGHSGSGQDGYGQDSYSQNGYGQDSYSQNGYGQDGYSQNGYSQNGYSQNGYGQNGYSQDSYGQGGPGHPAFGPEGGGQEGPWQSGFGQPEYGDQGYEPQRPGDPRSGGPGPAAPSFTPGDYQPEAQAPTGFGQADPFGQADGQTDSFGRVGGGNGFAPVSSAAVDADGAQATYTQDPYRQDAYGQDGYAHSDYDQSGFGSATRQETYGQNGGYPQPQAGSGFGGDLDDGSRAGGKPAPRLGGMRMVLYLAASVIGVVAIVFLVIHLTKSGSKTPAASASSPAATAKATTAAPAAVSYKISQATKVGTYSLNTAATDQYGSVAEARFKVFAAKVTAAGAGKPGTPVVGYYNMTSETNVLASDYQGIAFTGYNGTFTPASVIKLAQSSLASPQVESAGPHGGDMVCGLDTSSGRDASECIFVTKTTLGSVEFIKAGYTAEYSDPSTVALQVRNAVEVKS